MGEKKSFFEKLGLVEKVQIDNGAIEAKEEEHYTGMRMMLFFTYNFI